MDRADLDPMIATESNVKATPSRRGEPVWDLAFLYPAQGEWTEDDYLALQTGRMIEISDGCIEVLPVATLFHQFIVQYLFKLLDEYVRTRNLGSVATAPVPIRVSPGKLREPDVFFVRPHRIASTKRPPDGADLIFEVLSEGDENRRRDLETKRREYAQAGVAEYWIVDPEAGTITVLALVAESAEYAVHGEFGAGSNATSKLLADFSVDVAAALAAGDGPTPEAE